MFFVDEMTLNSLNERAKELSENCIKLEGMIKKMQETSQQELELHKAISRAFQSVLVEFDKFLGID